ncbi:hypothetical protein A3A38_02625 [Candidatus Kaiserbacteria bacterium RIFCSPLOWO2_01_FULL_53_17]|uniref:Homeodomain phBC6A51-type domain-containing protein n=1 Tax=Candidatus Kaiserbacteria bacterium RIFCSPLOWO2_01_FULL_53_17 TaxID=1798511 RepID=A0A1F6EGR1_9BACT|nr:MAG: hypothetical protein A3A38_02625 [Candidatus Kaiserbacteria bacterium RIFCSPLOWO2_01_FULL_53_17]
MNNEKKQNTIQERQQREKELILAQLRKMPIVSIACEKAGVGRTTYARWRSEDDEFRKVADEAMHEGDDLLNDMTETQLMNLIKNQKPHFGAIRYRLSRCHPKYADKLQLLGSISIKDERLTPEQEAVVREALKMVAPSEQITAYEPDESD